MSHPPEMKPPARASLQEDTQRLPLREIAPPTRAQREAMLANMRRLRELDEAPAPAQQSRPPD